MNKPPHASHLSGRRDTSPFLRATLRRTAVLTLALAAILPVNPIRAQAITDTGTRVGIGTSSPERSLHVRGDCIRLDRNVPNPGIQIMRFSSDWSTLYKHFTLGVSAAGVENGVFYISDVHQATGGTSGDWRLVIDNTGNVGIGTSTPAQMLDVAGNVAAGGGDWTGFYANANGATATLRVSNPTSYGETIGFTGTDTNTPFAIRTNAVVREWISESGNVGIGTIAPTVRLSLGTPVEAKMLALHDSPASWYGFGIQPSQMRLQVGNTGARFSFFAGDSNEIVTFRGNGNVGIGVTWPSETLEVNGTIRAKEVLVEATPWPDDVFEPGYQLPSVNDVAAHIQSSGHLPGVPSAATVGEKGVALGEMQKTLLRKVEELTLYVIQQQREIEALRTRLDANAAQSRGGTPTK